MPQARWSNRRAQPMMARLVVPEPPDTEIKLAPAPCPSCELLTLVRHPDEDLVRCDNGSCGAVLAIADYEAMFGTAPWQSMPRLGHAPVVYYMRLANIVKIGWSGSLGTRLLAINPQGVMAVEWGGRSVERQRHNQFADDHVHGEWFWLTDTLGEHIAHVRAEFERSTGRITEDWLREVGAG